MNRQVLLFLAGGVFIVGAFLVRDSDGGPTPPGNGGVGEAVPLSLSPASGPPGTRIRIEGKDFAGNETVRVSTLFGQILGDTVATGEGAVSFSATLPNELPNGNVLILAQGLKSGRVGSTPFEVRDSPFG